MVGWYEENDNYETNIHSINKREKLEILIITKIKEFFLLFRYFECNDGVLICLNILFIF